MISEVTFEPGPFAEESKERQLIMLHEIWIWFISVMLRNVTGAFEKMPYSAN